MTTTLKAYAETKTAAAFRRYDGMIAALRERSQMPATSLRRARQAGARP